MLFSKLLNQQQIAQNGNYTKGGDSNNKIIILKYRQEIRPKYH